MHKKVIGTFVACLVLLAAALGCGANQQADRIGSSVGISALVALADSHISSYANALDALSMTQEVQSGNWDEMKGLVANVEQAQVPAMMWFALPDGSYYNVKLGLTGKNISDRAYFPGLMAGNKVLGDVVLSKATGNKSLIVASPVVREGKVIGALGVSIFLDGLSTTLRTELAVPADMVFYATTETGEVVLHSDAALIVLQNPQLPQNVVFETSPLTGWRFALGYKD